MDIGCGICGPGIELVKTFHAKKVTGIDLEPEQIARANRNIEQSGVKEKILTMHVKHGPLPFEVNTFDIVFSKDSLNEARNKKEVFLEIFRVLKPGGWFVASDWMKGDGELTREFRLWVQSADVPFEFETISGTKSMLENIGFSNVVVKNRNLWYREEARDELAKIEGSLWERLVDIQHDEQIVRESAEFWRIMIKLLDSGEFCPAHIRAQKIKEK